MDLNVATIRVRGLVTKKDVQFARYLTKNGLIVFGNPATDRAWLSGKKTCPNVGAVIVECAGYGPLAYLSTEPAGLRFPIIRVRACAADPGLSAAECGLAFGAALQTLERSKYVLVIDVDPQDIELRQILDQNGWEALQVQTHTKGPIRYLKGNGDAHTEDDEKDR